MRDPRCPVCGTIIQAPFVSCPTCAQAKSREAYHEFQRAPLRKVAAGEGALTTRAINHVRHIQMFGTWLSFCGQTLAVGNRRAFLAWEDLTQACPKCRAEVQRIAAEEPCASA